MDLIEVKISDITLTNVGFAVFLQSKDGREKRVVPIFIGPLETHSITSVLDGQIPPRPMTHDLLMTVVNYLGGKVIRVVIDEIINNTFYAKISIRKDEEILVIDARPSDSISLALRADAPIYIARKVFEEAGIQMKEGELPGENALDEESEDFQEDARTPLQILEDSLEAAIKAEDYESAARIRDQIKKIVESS